MYLSPGGRQGIRKDRPAAACNTSPQHLSGACQSSLQYIAYVAKLALHVKQENATLFM
jgi:hypothetical protein